MARSYTVTKDQAAEFLDYDPDTGHFTWKVSGGRGRFRIAGNRAGSIDRVGYRRIGVAGAIVYEHRLAWVMACGEIPSHLEIDHKNGARDDNRICNLRLVNRSANAQNKPIVKRGSNYQGVVATGTLGWSAKLYRKGIIFKAGVFKTEIEAHEAYKELRRALHHSFR